MSIEASRVYGFSSQLYVINKPNTDSLVLGGVAEDLSRWTRVLSTRAAHMLWFHLARLLLPEKIDQVTAIFDTTPLRSAVLPTITNHFSVEQSEEGYFEATGWAGERSWVVHLTDGEGRRLWASLDKLLFPHGWQGTQTEN